MRKVTVTFPGIDDTEITQTHFFNLTDTDVTTVMAKDPNFFKPSRLKALINRLETATGEDKVQVQIEMADFVKDVIVHSHGTRIEDQFFHIPEDTLRFTQGLALDAVIRKVLEDGDNLVDFFMGVLPPSLRDEFAKATKEQ